MENNRDDFTEKTKDRMAKRVGYRCSNPNCRKLTCGAAEKPDDYVNIGVAAHICAAAPGGKRYDHNMTSDERKSIINGIWLCQSCSKLIDSDELRYTEELLHQWKYEAETESAKQLENCSIGLKKQQETYDAVERSSDHCEYVQIQNTLNQEVADLLNMMEIIYQKLDAAKMENNCFLSQAYEKRLEGLMALYTIRNNQLSELVYMKEKEVCSDSFKQYAAQTPYKAQRSIISFVVRMLVLAFVGALLVQIISAIGVWILLAVLVVGLLGYIIVSFCSFDHVSYCILDSDVMESECYDKSKLGRMIDEIEVVRSEINQLAAEVENLHLERIKQERNLAEISRKQSEKK